MANENMRNLYLQGLQALHAADNIGRDHAASILQDASSPELKERLQQGSEKAQEHADELKRLLQSAGGQPGDQPNEIMQGIRTADQRIRQAAKDPATKDAGIIASGQIAMHYYVSAYGTLAAYAKQLGDNQAAETLSRMADECRQWDQDYTQLAERVINPQAAQG